MHWRQALLSTKYAKNAIEASSKMQEQGQACRAGWHRSCWCPLQPCLVRSLALCSVTCTWFLCHFSQHSLNSTPRHTSLNELFSLAALHWSTGQWTPHQGITLMLRVRMAYFGTNTRVHPGRRQEQLWSHLRISLGLGEKETPALHVRSCKGTTWTNFPYNTIKGKVATVPTKQFTP